MLDALHPHFDRWCQLDVSSLVGVRWDIRRLLDGTVEHAALVRPVEHGREQRVHDHVHGVDLEGQECVDGPELLVEAPDGDDGAEVSSGSNQSRNAGQLLRDHERHDAVAGALGHLHEGGESDEHNESHVPLVRVVDEPDAP